MSNRVIVYINGGLVQWVASDADVEVCVVDGDTEGTAPDDTYGTEESRFFVGTEVPCKINEVDDCIITAISQYNAENGADMVTPAHEPCEKCGGTTFDYLNPVVLSCCECHTSRQAQGKQFDVGVSRRGYGNTTIRVTARNSGEAHKAALDIAGNYEYSEHSSDYEVESVVGYMGSEIGGK